MALFTGHLVYRRQLVGGTECGTYWVHTQLAFDGTKMAARWMRPLALFSFSGRYCFTSVAHNFKVWTNCILLDNNLPLLYMCICIVLWTHFWIMKLENGVIESSVCCSLTEDLPAYVQLNPTFTVSQPLMLSQKNNSFLIYGSTQILFVLIRQNRFGALQFSTMALKESNNVPLLRWLNNLLINLMELYMFPYVENRKCLPHGYWWLSVCNPLDGMITTIMNKIYDMMMMMMMMMM